MNVQYIKNIEIMICRRTLKLYQSLNRLGYIKYYCATNHGILEMTKLLINTDQMEFNCAGSNRVTIRCQCLGQQSKMSSSSHT